MSKRPAENDTKRMRQNERLLFVVVPRDMPLVHAALGLTPGPPYPVDEICTYEYVVGSAADKVDMDDLLESALEAHKPHATKPDELELLDQSLPVLLDFFVGNVKRAPNAYFDYDLDTFKREEFGTWKYALVEGQNYVGFTAGPYKAVYVLEYDPIVYQWYVDEENLNVPYEAK